MTSARKRTKTKRPQRAKLSLYDIDYQWRSAVARYKAMDKKDADGKSSIPFQRLMVLVNQDTPITRAVREADTLGADGLMLRATSPGHVEIKGRLAKELYEADPHAVVDSLFADLCVAYGIKPSSLFVGKIGLPIRDTKVDAKLLKLLPTIYQLEEEWLAMRRHWAKQSNVIDRLALKKSGIKRIPITDAQRAELVTVREKIASRYYRRYGKHDDLQISGLNKRLYRLAERVLVQKAFTRAGLAAQMRVIALTDDEWFETKPEAEKARLTLLFKSICSFLDMTPAPARVEAWRQ